MEDLSPLSADVSLREDQSVGHVTSRVSWLTPRTCGRWSGIGCAVLWPRTM